ncbi:7-cyano-7-deazaguanine synthase [Pelotomaculum propionicicum]|uniref:7-cyano-7-deazaguanine synthase n=1 Tax=Pelotomaculum propionicicum TaxID=258475 RepID=A0A4Y7RK44_9FIRM|nr:7-cyano-7-deazaguanine synthase [Pelotomaculum propionicicum]NLI13965.1 7-cyano-7-deazaguanine synthase [Peptococcaceae bacterium]TEB09364.1 7-cyano-7-deazaguanine synthase [Pelotomaculum propionicicum]
MSEYDGVLLASGGMDSTVLAYDLKKKGKNIILLFLDYGQHCMEKEYETLKRVVPVCYEKNIKTIKIGDVYKESHSRIIIEANLWVDNVVAEDLYLPYRNLLFLSIASAYAQSVGVKNVYSAFINSNHAKEIDCSMDFFTKLESLLEVYGSVKINMPYREMSKTQVAMLGLTLGAPIAQTYSCQVNSQNPCGACPNCVDRIEAMNNLIKEV